MQIGVRDADGDASVWEKLMVNWPEMEAKKRDTCEQTTTVVMAR